MKFSNSERILHDVQFNPPCNYYNIDKKSNKNVLSGSLAGPRLISQDKNTFGYDKRFDDNSSKLTPGPNNYFVPKRELVYDFKTDLKNPKTFLKNTFRNPQQNPSIPYKILSQQNLDQEDKAFLKQLSLIQNPARAAQNIRRKEPAYSFAKSPRKNIESDLKKQNPNIKIAINQFEKINEKQQFEPIFQEKPTKKLDNTKNSLVFQNQAIRKANKKRNEIINNIGPDFVPSLELIDLMSKMRTRYVPGPGFYNPKMNDSLTNALQSLTDSNKKGAIFSTVKRFDVDKKSILGPGSYDTNYDSSSKKGVAMSKQKRSLFNMKEKTDIQYRFYINPDSDSKINVNTLPQRSNSCTSFRKRNLSEVNPFGNGFGSNSTRFSTSSVSSNEQDKKSQISEYEIQKKNVFKAQLKTRLKKLNSQDRRSTKEDSGLLGISTMASVID